ncbi:MAG: ribonuclease III family protein [Candidatus Bathyarchaeia archaeon]
MGRAFSFRTVRGGLAEVLADHDLASLGDSYVNFAYSLALSVKRKKPLGVKVKGSVLAEALRKAGLRDHLGSRMSRHALADAAEALIVYAWLNGCLTLDESVKIMKKSEDAVEGVSELLATVRRRVTFP